MSAPIEQVGFGRRQLLRYAGGAAVVAVAAGSAGSSCCTRSRRRRCRPRPTWRRSNPTATCSWAGPTAGSTCRRRRRSRRSTPTRWRRQGRRSRPTSSGSATSPDSTTPQRFAQKNKAQHSAPLFWVERVRPGQPRQRVRGRADQPRPGAAARPVRRPHAPLARVPQRDPVLRRRADRLGVGAGRARVHLRLPAPRPRHVHVPLPRRGRRARAHGHDRPRVRPAAAGRQHVYSPERASTSYNDGDGSTGFDREFAMFLSEVWAESHWADAHIQLPEWSDYHADFSLLNGRVYPDTLAAERLDRRRSTAGARRRTATGAPTPAAALPASSICSTSRISSLVHVQRRASGSRCASRTSASRKRR